MEPTVDPVPVQLAPRTGWRADAARVDAALYAAIARTPTPVLDRQLARLATAADHSKLSLAAAGVLAAVGGPAGRRAALHGLVAIGAASALVNLAAKPLGRRRRPDPVRAAVAPKRHVPMPASAAFPSGHAASAFAFATGVGHVMPRAAVPLRALAALVAYSRVHVGVHYPGDVVAGALAGSAIAQLTTRAIERRRRR